jgi:hypothetical protein
MDRIRYRLALSLKHLDLAQFRHDLFWFVSLACYRLNVLYWDKYDPSRWTTSGGLLHLT